MIGAELGAAIIEPLGHGYVDGISYVLLPCGRELSAWRPSRIVQRGRLRGPIFRWLHSAARAAADHHAGRSDAAENFHHAVEHLLRQPSLSDEIARAARGALARLESKAWRPRHSFDHNDLYLSNIMLPGMDARASSRHPFVLIDWAGANPDGFGMYDLMRLARAFRLPVAKIRGELVAHASALHCQTSDLSGHLLASLGRLHQHLEHFPEDRFMAIADVCWALYRQSAEGSGR